jgi:FkbM family methyltransferase
MYLRESASRAFTLLTKNPPLFGRVMLAKTHVMRPAPLLPAMRHIGNVKFEIDSTHKPSAVAMYFDSYSPLVVNAMRSYLHPGEVFIDVGANVGYVSAIGADIVGPSGQVHSFEPVPRYFHRLRRLAQLNPEYSIAANRCAVGADPGSATIQITREPGQNTLVPGYKTGFEVATRLEVPVTRLDSYIESHHIPHVALIKIDAEGFELPALEGMRRYFEASGDKPVIICEIAPRAYPLMGRRVSELSELMSHHGYTARDIIDGLTPVDISALKHVTDVLFLARS